MNASGPPALAKARPGGYIYNGKGKGEVDRDEILMLDDAALSRIVKLEFSRGSGNGGQKRNKTSTAVRVVLDEYGVSASDCSERSQHRNRAEALRKLRMNLALKVRCAPLPPPRSRVATTAPEYPLYAARLLDNLADCGGDYRLAAEKWGVSPTSLLKNVGRDPALLKWLNDNYPKYFIRTGGAGAEDAEKEED